jgi:hypothetical protein
MYGMENLEIEVQNIQAKYNCLFLRKSNTFFPLKYTDIIRLIMKTKGKFTTAWV